MIAGRASAFAGAEAPLLGRLDLDRQLARIVGEIAPPTLFRRAPHQDVAEIDGVDRVAVEVARPAHRDLPPGGDQVTPEDGAALRILRAPAAALCADQHRL